MNLQNLWTWFQGQSTIIVFIAVVVIFGYNWMQGKVSKGIIAVVVGALVLFLLNDPEKILKALGKIFELIFGSGGKE